MIPVGHVILTIDESGENANTSSSDSGSDDDVVVKASEPAANNVPAHK